MRRRPWYAYLIGMVVLSACGCLSLGFDAPTVLAQRMPPPSAAPLAQPRDGASSHVTIIVLDMSGSMAQNDPNGIRCSAAYAYIDLSGPGDVIGVIDLDGGEATDIATPAEMATQAARDTLKATIRAKTNNCHPDADTPTASALEHAAAMLTTATVGGIPGSVILLTDGIPAPNPDAQKQHISNDLVPEFRSHNWPIDTIALGQPDADFHAFLNDVARGTGGQFYDDGKGVVASVNPLNIADFFIQIFTARVGHSIGPAIPPTALTGGTVARDFTLASNVDYFAVIIVKDQASAQVTLSDPNGHAVQSGPDVFVSTDPRYVMYIITGPQGGHWAVSGSGSGEFLAESLIDSALKLTITAPGPNPTAQPLGAPMQIAATLTYHGAVVTNGYTVQAVLTFAGDSGGAAPYKVIDDLHDQGGTGTYSDTITVPVSEPSGSYTLVVGASQTSGAFLTSSSRTLSLALFPAAVLFQHGTTVGDPVTARVVAFDKGLQILYGASNPVVNWLSQQPLDHHSALTNTVINGQVQLNGQPYCHAKVKGVAHLHTGGPNTPITVTNSGCGAFQVIFPAGVSGTYDVALQTSGSFEDSLGIFGPAAAHQVNVQVAPATMPQELRAWLWTLLLYPLITFIIISVIRSRFMPNPAKLGTYRVAGGVSGARAHPIEQTSLYWQLMQRNIVPSESLFKKPGMALLVERNGVVKARRARWFWLPGRDAWRTGRGDALPAKFTAVNEVYVGHPTNPHYVFGGGGAGRFASRAAGPQANSGPGRGATRGGPPRGPTRGGPPPKRPAGPPPRPSGTTTTSRATGAGGPPRRPAGPPPHRAPGPPGRR